jgi:carboxyl-terminal processing protease
MTRIIRTALALVLACAAPATAQERGALFDEVVDVLGSRFYDKGFREQALPAVARRFADEAHRARSSAAERAVVHAFLGELDVSHLALYSEASHAHLMAELAGRDVPTLGFQLVEDAGAFHVARVLEGGPASVSGVRRGDRLVALDGLSPERSPRLDWRSDDAALPDPPTHLLLGETGDEVQLVLERAPGERYELRLSFADYSGMDALRASVRVAEVGPYRVGYAHAWYIPFSGLSRFVERCIADTFAGCDALVFDLRGRGGSAAEAARIVELLHPERGAWRKPLVVLVDAGTRSAKEVITSDLRRSHAAVVVGETTPGAVIPATFETLRAGGVLMFPAFTLGAYTHDLEGHGIVPDVEVRDVLAYSAGRDPILEAGWLTARAWCELRDEGAAR